MTLEAGKYKFESPVEQRLAEALFPTLGPHVAFGVQRQVHTGRKKYRVDFWFNSTGRMVVVEADGRDFHDYDLDRERDTDMLLHGNVRAIARFRGCDIYCADQQCVQFFHAAFPEIAEPSRGTLDRDALKLLRLEMDKLPVKPTLRVNLDGKLIELHSTDIDGRFHARSNTATRIIYESEAKEIQKIVDDEFGGES